MYIKIYIIISSRWTKYFISVNWFSISKNNFCCKVCVASSESFVYIFKIYFFPFNLSVFLDFLYVSCKLHIVGCGDFSCRNDFCLLADELNPFSSFNIISYIQEFKFTILFCASYLSHTSDIYSYLSAYIYIYIFVTFLAIFWIELIPLLSHFSPFASLKVKY